MPTRKSSRQTTHDLFMFWIYFRVLRSVPSKFTLKGRPYANLCPLLPSPSIQRSVVKCSWLLKQSLHTYQLDRSTRTVSGFFLNGSLVFSIYLQGCEPLEFKILMFTNREASNLPLFNRESWSSDEHMTLVFGSLRWSIKSQKLATLPTLSASHEWRPTVHLSFYKVPLHPCFSKQLPTAPLQQNSLC